MAWGGSTHRQSHAASGLHGRRGQRPPTWGEGVTEAKEEEEGSARGRQEVGTRSWEAGAQGGRPGAGAVGTRELPHIAFSCSSVTYLGKGRTRTQEMALPKGRSRGGLQSLGKPGSSQQEALTLEQKAFPP